MKNKLKKIAARNFKVVRFLTTLIISCIFCNLWMVLEYVILGKIVDSYVDNIMMTLFIPIIYISAGPIVHSFIGQLNDNIFMRYADIHRVVCLPCKIGDKLRVVDDAGNTETVVIHSFELYALQQFAVDKQGRRYNFAQFGKTVFYDMCDNAVQGVVGVISDVTV